MLIKDTLIHKKEKLKSLIMRLVSSIYEISIINLKLEI